MSTIASKVRVPLNRAVELLMPRAVWRHRVKVYGLGNTYESEERLIPYVCDKRRISIDIGAAEGAYTTHMLIHSARVIAFEPRPDAARALRDYFRFARHVQIEQVALSNRTGEIELRVPEGSPLLSSVEEANTLEGVVRFRRVRTVMRCLDNYALTEVGFIKVDVEGHEAAVLEGARQTLVRERPAVLVEAEERHRRGAVQQLREFFQELGYRGMFLVGNTLRSIDDFDASVHQVVSNLDVTHRRTGEYVNNFLFLPKERATQVRRRFERG